MSKRTIEEYRAIVAARPEGEKRTKISRHQHLMNQKPTRPQRQAEIKKYKELVLRSEKECERQLHLLKARQVSFRDKQTAYDEGLGMYQSRTFLESALRQRGIDPEEEIEDMLEQYRLSKSEKPMAAVASIAAPEKPTTWDDLLEEEE